MICRACKAKIPNGALVCATCRRPQGEVKACRQCGEEIPPAAKLCHFCKSPQEEEKKEEQKACVVCAEQIPLAAKKCTHCSSGQRWWRHLDLGNTALALLIALISVITAAVPVWTAVTTKEESEVRATVLVEELNESKIVRVLCSNIGARGTAVRGATLEADDGVGEKQSYELTVKGPPVLLAAGGTVIVEFEKLGIEKPQKPITLPKVTAATHAKMTLKIVPYGGEAEAISCKFP